MTEPRHADPAPAPAFEPGTSETGYPVAPSETAPPEPTVSQMRTWLRANADKVGFTVGRRGFLSADAVKAYRDAHGLPTV